MRHDAAAYQISFSDEGRKGILDGISRSFHRVCQFCERRFSELKNRYEMRKLLELDENQLKDINVSKEDVSRVLKLPLDQKAGHALTVSRRNKT